MSTSHAPSDTHNGCLQSPQDERSSVEPGSSTSDSTASGLDTFERLSNIESQMEGTDRRVVRVGGLLLSLYACSLTNSAREGGLSMFCVANHIPRRDLSRHSLGCCDQPTV